MKIFIMKTIGISISIEFSSKNFTKGQQFRYLSHSNSAINVEKNDIMLCYAQPLDRLKCI